MEVYGTRRGPGRCVNALHGIPAMFSDCSNMFQPYPTIAIPTTKKMPVIINVYYCILCHEIVIRCHKIAIRCHKIVIRHFSAFQCAFQPMVGPRMALYHLLPLEAKQTCRPSPARDGSPKCGWIIRSTLYIVEWTKLNGTTRTNGKEVPINILYMNHHESKLGTLSIDSIISHVRPWQNNWMDVA